jgi:hypothetical protein
LRGALLGFANLLENLPAMDGDFRRSLDPQTNPISPDPNHDYLDVIVNDYAFIPPSGEH